MDQGCADVLIKTLVFIALSAAPAHCQGVGSVTTPTAPAGQSATSAVNGSAAAPPPYHAIPSQAFLDHYASVISSTVLVKNHKDAAAAAADAQLIFATAQRYAAAITAALPGLPKGNILYSLATSQLYTMVDQFLTAVAAPLPDQVKLDRFASNLTLSVLPGLTTALTGFSYSPCLLDVAGLGAIAGVQGIGISPKFFNTGPVGAAAVAEAISIAPALIYSTQTGDSLAAIGIDIAPSLITVSPAKYIYLREGVSAGPIGLDVAFAPASPAPPAAPAAPAAPGVNTTGYFPVLGG